MTTARDMRRGAPWWADDERHKKPDGKGCRYESIWEEIGAIETADFAERERRMRKAYLFDPTARLLGDKGVVRESPAGGVSYSPTTINIVKSVVDTANARLASHRVKPVMVTDGADWATQRTARNLEKFVDADWERAGLYEEAGDSILDGMVVDLGAIKIFPRKTKKGWRVHGERVLRDRLIIDEKQYRNGRPRTIHERDWVDQDILLADIKRWVKDKARLKEIEEALIQHISGQPDESGTVSGRKPHGRMVCVAESWHLASGPDEDDGRHVISIANCDIIDEEWKHEYLPFVFFRWSKRMTGVSGNGLVDELVGTQYRINKGTRVIEESQNRFAIPRVWVDSGNRHLKVRLDDVVGQVVEYVGKPPVFMTPPAANADLYQYLEGLEAGAYRRTGVAEAAAQGAPPPGYDSGVAIREARQEQSGRFARQEQRVEEFYIAIARLWIAVQHEIATEIDASGTYTVNWRTNKAVQKIDWKDSSLPVDAYEISVRAASLASMSPSARKQFLIELTQAGIISQDVATKHMDHPDISSELSLLQAGIEDIDANIEDVRDWGEGKYKLKGFPGPDPYQNLALGVLRFQQARARDKRSGAPQKVLDGYGIWLTQAKGIMQKVAQEAQAEAQAVAAVQAAIPQPAAPNEPGFPAPARAPGGATPGFGTAA